MFTFTSLYHIYRIFDDSVTMKIDPSFALMIMVAKYNSFAWCYRDGAMPESSLTQDQNYRKIENLPGWLEFFSYSYFFIGGSIISPYFDFKDFELFIRREGRYKNPPSSLKYVLMMFGLAVLHAAFFEFLTPIFNKDFLFTSEFSQKSIWYKVLYVEALAYVLRAKFHTGFNLAQASTDAVKFSYAGVSKTGEHEFNAVMSSARVVETATSARETLERWNSSIHVWLKRCVYQRVIDLDTARGQKPNVERATWTTFAVSAFWHGFHPSYYTTFFMMWLGLEFGRNFFRAQ